MKDPDIMFLFFLDVVETTSNYVSLDVDTIQMGVTCILLHLIHCTNSAKRTPFHQREFLVIWKDIRLFSDK